MRFPSFGRRRGASYNPAHSPVETVHLPAESLAPSLAYFIFIVVLQIAVIVLLAVVVFVDIVLQHYNDRLTSRGQLVYTLLVTATATLVGTTTEGELRKLWAYVVIKSKDVDRDEDGEEGAREGMAKVRKISVVLGLGKLGDMVRRVYIPVGLGLAGLVTTAIVTGLQPTDMVVARDLPIFLSQSRNLSFDGILGRACNRAPFSSMDAIPSRWFTWPYPQAPSRNLTVSATRIVGRGEQCPTDHILPTFQTLSTSGNRNGYTLPGSSILVDRSASGVPYDLIYYAGFRWLQPNTYKIETSDFGTWSMASFAWASLCVPLLTKRIASCRPAENVKRMTDRIEVTAGNCTVGRAIHEDSEHDDGEMVAGACTEGRGLGKATILMGATGSYAGQLWDAVISPEIDWPERGEREFSVACEIDVDDSALSFHRVMVAPFDRDSHSTPEEYHTWRVSGARAAAKGNAPPTASRRDEWGEQCTPLSYSDSPLSPSQFLTPETLTAAASSSWQLLAENMYRDGHLTTLLNAAESYADRVYEKDDEGKGVPRSTMEDLLTRAASMAVGFHLGAYSGQNLQSWPGDLESEYEGFWTEVRGGEVAYRSVRVGVREAWGLGVGFCGARGAGFGADGVVVVGGEEGPGWEGEGWKGERE